MNKEFEIPQWRCHRQLKNTWVGSGADSDVYRDGNFVVKVYKNGPFAESHDEGDFRVVFYRDVTNKAAEIVGSDGFTVYFPFSKETYRLSINPYLEVARCVECDQIEGVSSYVPGKYLPQLLQEFDLKELNIVFKRVSQKLEDMLGVIGINIIPFNVKKGEGDILVVTDLCSDIADLRPLANSFAHKA